MLPRQAARAAIAVSRSNTVNLVSRCASSKAALPKETAPPVDWNYIQNAPQFQSRQTPSDPKVLPIALSIPPVHDKPYGIPVAMLHLRSPETPLLDLFVHFALHSAYAFGIPCSRAASLPTKRSLFTVLKGPFAHKKSQENFERVVHKRAIKVWDADGEVVGKWIKYLELHALGGVGMRVVRWERAEVGFGKKHLESVAQESKLSSRLTTAAKVRALGEKIVKAELLASAGPSASSSSQAKASPSSKSTPKSSPAPKAVSSLDSKTHIPTPTEASKVSVETPLADRSAAQGTFSVNASSKLTTSVPAPTPKTTVDPSPETATFSAPSTTSTPLVVNAGPSTAAPTQTTSETASVSPDLTSTPGVAQNVKAEATTDQVNTLQAPVSTKASSVDTSSKPDATARKASEVGENKGKGVKP